MELLVKLEFELGRLEGGRGLDVPVALVLGHLRKDGNYFSKVSQETSKVYSCFKNATGLMAPSNQKCAFGNQPHYLTSHKIHRIATTNSYKVNITCNTGNR